MNNLHFHAFEDEKILVQALRDSIICDLEKAILENGRASLIVSGGSTPKPLFDALSVMDIAWDKVTIGLCDERWVPTAHDDSNEKLVKETLMRNHAANALFVGMLINGTEADAAEQACSEKIKTSLWPFDVMILGMGGDAHTASLFPNNPKLPLAYDNNRQDICIAIHPSNAPHARMSLTLAAIMSSKHLYLHFQGKSKLAVYHEALHGDDAIAMPIRSIVCQNQKEVEVYYA